MEGGYVVARVAGVIDQIGGVYQWHVSPFSAPDCVRSAFPPTNVRTGRHPGSDRRCCVSVVLGSAHPIRIEIVVVTGDSLEEVAERVVQLRDLETLCFLETHPGLQFK